MVHSELLGYLRRALRKLNNTRRFYNRGRNRRRIDRTYLEALNTEYRKLHTFLVEAIHSGEQYERVAHAIKKYYKVAPMKRKPRNRPKKKTLKNKPKFPSR